MGKQANDGSSAETRYSPEQIQDIVKYELFGKMSPYFDKHMILCILSEQEANGVYNVDQIRLAQIDIAARTSMIDVCADKYAELGKKMPNELEDRKNETLEQLYSMKDSVMELLSILEDRDKVALIHTYQSIEEMCTEFSIMPHMVEQLGLYAKMQYDTGNYDLSAELLKHYRSMPHAKDSIPGSFLVSCWWGALACALLQSEDATELILKLDEVLDNSKAPKREVLLHRTWLLHWTLFAIFNSARSQNDTKLLDFFLKEASLSIISLSCPHLFRYVGACLILQKRLKNVVKDTVWIINHESGIYSDPITRFLLALYTEMDYDDAQRELQSCEMVCMGDYFLKRHWPEFQENARLHIFESYCRIHQCINIEMIASKLNMQAEEAELWIVKLIQSAKLDARIDSEKKRVVMTKAPPNVYQQVIEKTKNLAFRSTMLVSNMEKERN